MEGDIVKSSSTWHPFHGWYLTIVAAILLVGAALSLTSARKGAEEKNITNTGEEVTPRPPHQLSQASGRAPLVQSSSMSSQQDQHPIPHPDPWDQQTRYPPQQPIPGTPQVPFSQPQQVQSSQQQPQFQQRQIPPKVQCPNCSTIIQVDPTKIAPDGKVYILCLVCGRTGSL